MSRDERFLFHSFKLQIMRISTLPGICNLIFTMCLNWKTSTRKNALLRKYNRSRITEIENNLVVNIGEGRGNTREEC